HLDPSGHRQPDARGAGLSRGHGMSQVSPNRLGHAIAARHGSDSMDCCWATGPGSWITCDLQPACLLLYRGEERGPIRLERPCSLALEPFGEDVDVETG